MSLFFCLDSHHLRVESLPIPRVSYLFFSLLSHSQCRKLAKLNLIPFIFGEPFAGVLTQKYTGHVTIFPDMTLVDSLKAISHPSRVRSNAWFIRVALLCGLTGASGIFFIRLHRHHLCHHVSYPFAACCVLVAHTRYLHLCGYPAARPTWSNTLAAVSVPRGRTFRVCSQCSASRPRSRPHTRVCSA